MGSVTVEGILLYGDHASRPSSGVATGTLYSCSDHDLVYQTTDNGATWVTWASLGGSVPSFASPTIALGSSAATGAADSIIRSDATIAAFDGTNPAATVAGDTAVVGVAAYAARRDHVHPRLLDRALYEFVIDGGGSVIGTGIKGDLYVPDAFTITGVVMLADQSGSIVVDIWNDTYANYPPTDADSLPGGGTPPTISSATKSKDTALTSWDTTVPADSTLRFNVDSATTVTRVVIAIYGVRT